tara:strand:- start:1026 stop:1910 length:885 start_codon:yes stop_codon:yes gene_type:complete
MGISTSAAELVFKLSKKINFKGNLLQIGNQDILFNKRKLFYLLNKYNLNKKKFHFDNKISSKAFFKIFEFKAVKSLDVNQYENADIIEDLNYPLKEKFKKKFDFIYDGGSLEHVFNIAQGLKNLTYLVKKNGYIMHLLPVNNYIDHGFYSFSPTLFKDYYIQNNFKIIDFFLIKQNYNLKENHTWYVYEYNEDQIKDYDKWNWKNNRMLVWVVVKKNKNSKKIIYPTQSKYLKLHRKKINKKNVNSKVNLKTKIKMKFPITYDVLKVTKYMLSKSIRSKNKSKVSSKPNLLFKC